MNYRILVCLAMAIAVLSCNCAQADIIHLKNGNELEGKIASETKDYIELSVSEGTVTFQRNEIASIERKDFKFEKRSAKITQPPQAQQKPSFFGSSTRLAQSFFRSFVGLTKSFFGSFAGLITRAILRNPERLKKGEEHQQKAEECIRKQDVDCAIYHLRMAIDYGCITGHTYAMLASMYDMKGQKLDARRYYIAAIKEFKRQIETLKKNKKFYAIEELSWQINRIDDRLNALQ